MKTITLKDIPDNIHAAIKHRARLNGRSMNREAIACLEIAVAPTRTNARSILREIRKRRDQLGIRLTHAVIRAATEENRP
ncbi:Arc family DNA-binding protein [Oscillatoria laete-virens NRMC-F 0139]|nr:Arc family DNA-binding protein [Oscillatoria laete-virens NRMC-F 0139]